ncbi:MAG: 30S ribosomal protein S6 [Spirochaetia bacterium]|nr:30S ribosomal protein S6 [Spirochaetia bacterium]
MAQNKQGQYEMTFVLVEKDAAALDTIREEIKTNLVRRNAQISKADNLGSKPLFHEKNHHKRGNFNCWQLTTGSENLSQINADLRVNSNILKSMIVKAG